MQKTYPAEGIRKNLKKIEGERKRFYGTFSRMGGKIKKGSSGLTVLVKNVVDVETKQIVTDHVWFNFTNGFKKLGWIERGEIIAFDARVLTYSKGYRGKFFDYKLSHPSKVTRM